MVKFIAEISSNHNGDLSRSKELIRMAKQCGFDAVKFQMFKVDQLFSPEALRFEPKLLERKRWEFPTENLPILSDYSHGLGLEFSCTPFYLEAVEILSTYCDFLKIASYELLWHDLADRCAATGLPLIISTGMATIDEIDRAVENLRVKFPAIDLSLLHAVSSYPAPILECNLAAIQSLSARYGLEVGWSDHTVSSGVVSRAIHKFGASVVEMHVDLDGLGFEFEAGHCWLPKQAECLISEIREGLLADGDGQKKPAHAEIPDRAWRADPSDGLRPLLEMRKNLGLAQD
jgi:sialic acid synthase SpsE